jgi:hypothetical protein
MAHAALGRIVCDPDRLAAIVEGAALRSGTDDAHDVMYTRLYPDRIETPASSPDAAQVSYCTGYADQFASLSVSVDRPVDALFDVDRSLALLEWLGENEDEITVTFEGDPATGATARLVHEGDDATVTLPADTEWTDQEVDFTLPDRFADDHLLDGEGAPVPTVATIQTAGLERLVRGSELVGGDSYTLEVREGSVAVEASEADWLSVAASAPADVTGPAVTRHLAPGLARVVRSVQGPVELQTGPSSPLAIVRRHEHFTMRFVVSTV